MLSSLANYLLGSISSAQDSSGSSDGKNVDSFSVVARLSQVEVEGDDWILIERTEGPTALEESWYVTPPACFTRAGPVNVETSPLEDLLIEHPSMSVYRATASSLVTPETPPPTPNAPEDLADDVSVLVEIASAPTSGISDPSANRRDNNRNSIQRGRTRPAIHDGRPSRTADKVCVVQLRSAQKVFEKRSTQALKRGRLERGNKLREVFSMKGKRPRRQDRLRLQNSGANNNRKC
ncbi:tumor protein p53-inducible nuclear protein 2 isoform X2 [Prorops nasuta]|uniref:tumor protein p53-inducible nuclear protein 2 isoform X2 n=1 Tax=Prorops nasuta TaxID=863751 RepID=UPI0034CD4CA0